METQIYTVRANKGKPRIWLEGKQYILQVQLAHQEVLHTIPVQGVREGRKVAKQYNATPWNF